MDNLTKTLAVEWAPSGIRVNAVAPGVVYSDSAAANYGDPAIMTSTIPSIPAKRLGTVEEVRARGSMSTVPTLVYVVLSVV